MAPVNEHPCFATDNLILASPRKFYRAYMHAGHWQLRAFVHSPRPNRIQYLGWGDIYEVNTTTKIRRIIGTLPFSARSFTSENGILCCGGEKGKFCVIRLSDTGSASREQQEGDSAPNSTYRPVNPWLPPSGRASTLPDSSSIEAEVEVEEKQFGDHLVNCINLWFPHDEAEEGTHNRPVAVIASNDGHIYIADLQTKELVQKLPHDEPVNMGKISPDGSLLVVVGDDPYMHVYKRKRVSHDKTICSASDTWEWEKFSQTKLPGQRVGNKDDTRGSFTGSFSHRYLAIGEQFGQVAIFELEDIQNLQYPRPAVLFKSTRPNSKEGAIRSLHFNPNSSLDLLAITEDHGRVLVVDVRQFGRQQMLETDRDAGYEEVSLKQPNGPPNSHDGAAAVPDADTMDDEAAYSNALVRQERAQMIVAEGNRRSEELPEEMDPFHPHGNRRFSQEEMRVLLAMQTQRRRRDWQELTRERARRELEAAANPGSSVTPNPSEPLRRYTPAPHSHDRLRVINETLGNPSDPNRTAEALERALATHMSNHRRRVESRAARRRESGQEITEAEAEQEAVETRTAHAMARMLSLDAENARRQAGSLSLVERSPVERSPAERNVAERSPAERMRERGPNWFAEQISSFDVEALRANGYHRTARTVLRISNDIQRIEAMERARREREGGNVEEEPREHRLPFSLSRRAFEMRPPGYYIGNRSPGAEGDSSPTVRLPVASEPGPSDPSPPAPDASPDPFAGIRRHLPHTPSIWGGAGSRSYPSDPEFEESLSPEARQLLLRQREASQRRSLMREREISRRQQGLAWIPPEAVMNNEDGWSNVRASPALESQTTGCAWSPDGQTLYVGIEGGIYEYKVDVQNRRVHPAFQLR